MQDFHLLTGAEVELPRQLITITPPPRGKLVVSETLKRSDSRKVWPWRRRRSNYHNDLYTHGGSKFRNRCLNWYEHLLNQLIQHRVLLTPTTTTILEIQGQLQAMLHYGIECHVRFHQADALQYSVNLFDPGNSVYPMF